MNAVRAVARALYCRASEIAAMPAASAHSQAAAVFPAVLPLVRCGAVALAAVIALRAAPVHAEAASACTAMTSPIYFRVNPTTQASLLTRWQSEAIDAGTLYGFTEDHGVPFKAGVEPASGLTAVHRLYNASSHDFVWIANPAEIANAIARYGYVDNGIGFYASTTAAGCAQPVYRFRKNTLHRAAVSQADRDALTAAGWQQETVSFYAVAEAAPVDTRFSIAIIPDSQLEVRPTLPRNLSDTRFRDRAQWLADNRDALDLRFVGHTGDVVNWGERDEYQYQVASDGAQPLDQAGIPFAFAVGNHDTRAVCPGGSACPGENASVNVRFSPLFDQYFGGRFVDMQEQYEPGKLSNEYSLFDAGGVRWMVLTLELWPRTAVIEWAKNVVASHPGYNVIVMTHSYLDSDGSIWTSNGGYGSNSPKYLFDNLIKVYPNIRFVFSGHVGIAASRLDTGVNGNRIASFMQTFHSTTTNPVRIVEIDTAANTAATHIYAPHDDTHYPQYDATVSGMDYVH